MLWEQPEDLTGVKFSDFGPPIKRNGLVGRFCTKKINYNWTRGSLSPLGYYVVNNKRVHRLVAELYVHNPRPDIFKIVDHINHERGDNRAENLRWVNHHLNMLNRKNSGKAYKNPKPRQRSPRRSDLREEMRKYRKKRGMKPIKRKPSVYHKWRSPPWLVDFPEKAYGFATEAEAANYLEKCRKDRFDEAYKKYLNSAPPFRDCGTQTTEKRLE